MRCVSCTALRREVRQLKAKLAGADALAALLQAHKDELLATLEMRNRTLAKRPHIDADSELVDGQHSDYNLERDVAACKRFGGRCLP